MSQTLIWQEPGREKVHLEYDWIDSQLKIHRLELRGGLTFLEYSNKIAQELLTKGRGTPLPMGRDSYELIWREVMQKILGQWDDPVSQSELCHCRRVSTHKVDLAVLYGAHTIKEVRKRTSANTGCGTCLPDVQALLDRRLVRP